MLRKILRTIPIVGDRVSAEKFVFDTLYTIVGVVKRVLSQDERTFILIVSDDLDIGEDWYDITDVEILERAEPARVEYDDGYCPHCHSYCFGDCEANGFVVDGEAATLEPFQKGDTGTVFRSPPKRS